MSSCNSASLQGFGKNDVTISPDDVNLFRGLFTNFWESEKRPWRILKYAVSYGHNDVTDKE